jgi:hypothetical protein
MIARRPVPTRSPAAARAVVRPTQPAATVAAILAVAALLPLLGCAKDARKQVEDSAFRKDLIEALVTDPARRQEVIDRLVGTPTDRPAVIERILKDEGAAGDLVGTILKDDRGKALVVSKVTSDDAGAKTFIRMLMLTGVMGASMTQQQSEMLGMGEAFSYGNRRRTISDLRKFGQVVEEWSKKEGHYPECHDLSAVTTCLLKKLQPESIAGLHLDDAWGRPFQYRLFSDGSGYALLSYATDGLYDGLGNVGPTLSVDCDIVFSNGDFVQWPGSLRKDELR